MSFRKEIEELTQQLLEPIIEERNYELVDVEYVKEAGNYYLRIYLDKDGGFTIDDCEYVSRALEAKLDEKDPIEEPYILEVSSPGLDRPLKKENDYRRSVGKLVEIKLYKQIDKKKDFVGILVKYNEDTVTVDIEEQEITFQKKDIALIRLAVIF